MSKMRRMLESRIPLFCSRSPAFLIRRNLLMMAREGLMGTHVSPSASLMLEKHAEKTKFLFIVKVNTKVVFRHSCHVPSMEALLFLQNLQTILFEFHSKKRKIKKFYRGPCFLLLQEQVLACFSIYFGKNCRAIYSFFSFLVRQYPINSPLKNAHISKVFTIYSHFSIKRPCIFCRILKTEKILSYDFLWKIWNILHKMVAFFCRKW